MYCPRCGQEQVSGDLKFCSRCGLPISLTAEVVRNGGILPQLEQMAGKRKFFRRANGLKFAAMWFVIFEMLFVPLVAIAGGEEEVAVLAVIGFVGAVIISILSFMVLDGSKQGSFSFENKAAAGQPDVIPGAAVHGALPPTQAQTADQYVAPATGAWNTNETGDIVRPGSVTEGTTKLFRKDEDG